MNTPLVQRKCKACEGRTLPLEQKFIDEYLESVSAWRQDGSTIKRDFSFSNFSEALAWVNRIGAVAESEGHHPDITLSWGKVGVSLTTHAIGGLSENDFILAAKIDELELIK
jgi:4a-hydroxytetrahydrobiopterin dehydratase